jgi:ribosomal protein L34E
VELILNEVQGMLREWAQDEVAQVAERDMDAMERSVQAVLRRVGGTVMGRLTEASVARREKTQPICHHCGRPMRLVEQRRKREMRGLVGDFAFARPYYQCRTCGGGLVPDDERLGVGAVGYTPALSRVAALTVTEVPFERAARDLSETLGATFAEADIYRVAEALGVVAETEMEAGMAAPQADPGAPAGDTLFVGVDGTTSFIDGDWHEVKVGVVGMLGPELRHDPKTGRDLMHASEHVWQVAGVFFGEGSLDTHAWVGHVLQALLEQGPSPLMDALGKLRPHSARQKRELQNAKDYFTMNRDRMRYPEFLAQHLPIGSGVVEATCRSLVCQRTKDAGMRWTRAGAQAVLNLRCLHLSHPDRWHSFFARHPLRRTPRLAMLRRPQAQAA